MSWPAPTGDPVGPARGTPPGAPAPSFGAPSRSGPQYPPAGSGAAPGTGVAPSSANGWPATSEQSASHHGAPPAPTGSTNGWPAPEQTASSSGTPGVSSSTTGGTASSGETGRAGAEVDLPAHGGIQTLAPESSGMVRLAPLHERTGQPVRPWTVWTSAVLLFGSAAAVVVGLLLAMWQMASPWQRVSAEEWTKIDRFNVATWLTTQFPSEPASGMRVLFAILCCLIAVLVAGTAGVVGYYAFAGYRWTRIGALVALGVSLLSLLLTPIAAISIGLAALGAAPLWLPVTNRFFARWQLIRHPQVAYSAPIDQVFYGPLPRYR